MVLDIFYLQKKHSKLFRFFERLPWVIIICSIILIIWGYFYVISSKEQFSILVIIIAFFLLFLFIWRVIKWIEYLITVFIAIFHLSKTEKTNFNNILFSKPKNSYEKFLAKKMFKDKNAKDIYHRVVIPTYNEEYEIIRSTFLALKNSDYDKKKLIVTLHWEWAKKEHFMSYIEKIKDEFENIFWFFDYSIHYLQPWEVVWKWANIKFWVKHLLPKVLEFAKTAPSNIIQTTIDADNQVARNYFSVLTYTYLCTKDRKHKAFQPMVYFFNNFWQVPFFSQLLAMQNTIWIVFNSMKDMWVKNFSSHAQPLDWLIELDFRSNQTIVEDGHQFWRSYFWFDWNYEVVPVYAKIYHDATSNTNFFSTAKAQYNQMRRWSHWVEDLPYIASAWLEKKDRVPFWRTLYEFVKHLESTINWSTMHLFILFWIVVTMIKDINFSSYVGLGMAVSVAISLTSTLSLFLLLMMVVIMPWKDLKNWKKKIFSLVKFLIWYFVLFWPILFIFSGLPALQTQLWFLFGKKIKVFNVTQKVRK